MDAAEPGRYENFEREIERNEKEKSLPRNALVKLLSCKPRII